MARLLIRDEHGPARCCTLFGETDIAVEVLGRKHVDIRRQSLPSFQVEGLLFDIWSEDQVVGVMPTYRIVYYAVQVNRYFADVFRYWRFAVERRYGVDPALRSDEGAETIVVAHHQRIIGVL